MTPGARRRPRTPIAAAAGIAAAAFVAMAAAGAVAAPVAAQLPGVVGLEARGGAAVGSYALTGAGLEMVPGPAWGAALTWGPTATLAAYAAFASMGFGCEGGLCGGFDVSLASRGMSVGVRGAAPIAGAPWLRAGVLLHRLEQRWTDSTGGRRSETTGAGPGAEAAAGLSWRIGDRVSVTPGVHLGFLPARGQDDGTDNVFFSALEVGLRLQP